MVKQDWMVIVAGEALVEALRVEQEARVPKVGNCFESEALCALQREQARRGLLGAEIVETIYGYSLRYDSGLQNFGLIRRGLGRDLAVAENAAREWQSEDPTHRYAWRRRRDA